jgi:hypothetical protein
VLSAFSIGSTGARAQIRSALGSPRPRGTGPWAKLGVRGGSLALAAALLAGALAGCGGQSGAEPAGQERQTYSSQAQARAARLAARRELARREAARRAAARPIVTPLNQATSSWRPVVRIAGRVAVWEAQRSGVTLLRFDQRLVRLALHAGLGEPEGTWTYGDEIGPREIHRVVAAFNGGFKFETGVIGFMADGRVAVALRPGLASIVTYRNGMTQIGAWEGGVPARGRPIASVLQNLHLLVDRGVPAASVESCIQECWGSVLGGGTLIARSALGIAGDGQLVWAAGESLSPAAIAQTLVGAGVQRAVELDINPEWVAGYLYVHGGSGPSAEPVVPGQNGIAGRFLEPYSRDFFTILAR